MMTDSIKISSETVINLDTYAIAELLFNLTPIELKPIVQF